MEDNLALTGDKNPCRDLRQVGGFNKMHFILVCVSFEFFFFFALNFYINLHRQGRALDHT